MRSLRPSVDGGIDNAAQLELLRSVTTTLSEFQKATAALDHATAIMPRATCMPMPSMPVTRSCRRWQPCGRSATNWKAMVADNLLAAADVP